MNKHALSTFSLLTGSRCSINIEPVHREGSSRSTSLCSSPDTSLLRGDTPNIGYQRRRLTSVSSTHSIARLALQDAIPDFVIPTRTVRERSSTLTAKAELMAHLDDKSVRDYNIVIKKEMQGENVASIKRRTVYDNLKAFELNKAFPRDQDFDCYSVVGNSEESLLDISSEENLHYLCSDESTFSF